MKSNLKSVKPKFFSFRQNLGLGIWNSGCYKALVLISLVMAYSLWSHDVYLRLTDYGGGKTNLVIEPFIVKGSENFIRTIKEIAEIIKNDLDYSLYFEIFYDTAAFSEDPKGSAIVLRGSAREPQLTILLQDFESRKKIGELTVPVEAEIRSLAHKLSDNIIEMLTGEKGISSTKIVFSYRKVEGKELAIIDYDGYNFTPLTKNNNLNLYPCWAPDGTRILYSTYASDQLNLHLFDLTKKEHKPISSFAGLNFAACWSPDGRKIALTLTKDGNAEIYLLDLETKRLRRLTNNRAIDCSPTFSPNSRQIAFVSDRSGNPQVYVMDIDGGNVERLTFHGSYNTSPAWSPRGDLIAYVSREDDYSQQIYITDPYDFLPIRLTYEGNNEDPSWSANGLHLVFTSNRTGYNQLYTMNWDGTRQRQLTKDIIAYSPAWSPFLK